MRSKLGKCFYALFLLCTTAAAPLAAQNGTITGTVTGADGRGLESVKVDAVAADGRLAATTQTNATGRYALSVPAGTYDVAVSALGYEETRSRGVSVGAGATAVADVTLRVSPFQLNPINITGNRGQEEKATESVSRVESISEAQIDMRPAVTPVDHLRGIPGVDIITQGVQSTNVVARGFNNIFSGSLHTLTDNRLAGVPSLRVNVMHFVPTTNDDLSRIEVVLGPGAALYGPNTASGVLHMITKSPLDDEGTSLSVMGGERDILQGALRTSHRLNDRVGFKLSGTFMQGTEWQYVDADEAAERAKFAADPFFRANYISSLGISAAEADRRIATIGARDNDIERWSGEARVDFRVTDKLTTVLQSGITNVGTGIELTGLGAGQVKDWRYTYYQARATYDRLFAQVYLNASDAGETFLLRTGQPIVDKSTLLVGQVQHGFNLRGWQDFTYGVDYFHTNPQTEGTINGIYENEDKTTEIGGYLQSKTTLTSKLQLVLAGRVDDHDALPDPIFSPRAALLFTPVENQAFRASYNRAFSTPTSLNQFLDLPTAMPDQATNPTNLQAARLGYSVRVQGTGTTGFTFVQPSGGYLMRSPFTPPAAGGAPTLVPTSAAAYFPAVVGVLAAQGAFATNPQLGQYLSSLRPTDAQIGTNFIVGSESFPISALNLAPIAPIRETTTTTYEVGYKGVLRNRLSLSADVWFSEIDDFVTPLTVSTPLLALNGQMIGAYLVPRFMQDLGMSQAQAAVLAGQLAPNMARVPVGVISTEQINANGAQLLATYTNVNESLDFWGTDLAAQFLLTDAWAISGTASIVSDDHFETTNAGTVTLNAPKRKGSLALEYRNEDRGLNGEVRGRYNAQFPVKSGVYNGTACLETDSTALPCVESYTLFDVTVGYAIPQLRNTSVQLTVQNLLDEDYRSFPGTPNVGRLALLRLRYEF